jgi:hypothetical protein
MNFDPALRGAFLPSLAALAAGLVVVALAVEIARRTFRGMNSDDANERQGCLPLGCYFLVAVAAFAGLAYVAIAAWP